MSIPTRPRLARAALLRAAALAACVLSMACGCTTARVDQRQEYWSAETAHHLPPGTSLENAEKFFAERGLKLGCCMSGPNIHNAHLALDRNVGRLLWTEYDIAIVVDISPSDKVERTRIFRWGVGL